MKRIILSGGGTGGHIYPAVAVAEALKRRFGDGVEILFVGAEGKMEMEKVPALGYRIVGLPIAGLQRRLDWRNLAVPFKAVKSIRMAKRIIRDFGADAVVGFGGYASAPVLWAAQRMGVPTVIQEQNSYAGVTNKILAKGARRICTAYEGMERFFPAAKIVLTGNPLRGRFSKEGADRAEALEYYGLTPDLPVILVVGGSLGTRSLNEMMKAWIVGTDGKAPVQVIWQTGKYYEREMQAFLAAHPRRTRLAGGFHRPHGLRLCRGRSGRLAQRGRDGLRVVPRCQAGAVRSVAQRGRGSSDQKRPGAGDEGRGGGRSGRRVPDEGDAAGRGAAGGSGDAGGDEPQSGGAGQARRRGRYCQ